MKLAPLASGLRAAAIAFLWYDLSFHLKYRGLLSRGHAESRAHPLRFTGFARAAFGTRAGQVAR